MHLFILLIPNIICLDQAIKDLVEEALLTKSKFESLSSTDAKMVKKGYNVFNGLTLFSTYNVLSSNLPEIQAEKYNRDKGLTALLHTSNIYDDEFVYKDDETGAFLKLEYYDSFRGVNVYNTTELDPESIFTHFKYLLGSFLPNVTCFDEGHGSRCIANQSLLWDDAEDKPILLEKAQLISGLIPPDLRIGSKIGATAFLAVDFNVFKFTLDYDLGFDARFGFGVSLNGDDKYSFDLYTFKYPITGGGLDFGGLNLDFGLFAYITLKVDDIIVKVPEPVSIYKEYRIKYANSGGFRGGKRRTGKFIREVQTISHDNISYDNIYDFLSESYLAFSPAIELGLTIQLKVLKLIDFSFDAGIQFRINFNFTANFKKCTFPYLYGTIGLSVAPFIRFSGIKLFAMNIIDGIEIKKDISLLTLPPRCMFSSSRSIEGDKSIKIQAKKSYSLIPRKATGIGKNYRIESVKLIAYEKNVVGKMTSYFDPPSSPGKAQNVKKNTKKMLLTNISPETQLILTATINTNKNEVFSISSDPHKINVLNQCFNPPYHDLCINLQLTNADYVEVFKEFPVKARTKMLSFNPYVPNDSELGMIMHGKNNESYSAPLLGNIYNDDLKNSTGKLNVKSEVKIGISSLFHKFNDLLSCKIDFGLSGFANKDSDPIMSININNPQKGVVLTSDALGIANKKVNFSMNNSSSKIAIKIHFKFRNKEKNFMRTISRSDIEKEPSFTIDIFDESFKLKLLVERIVPNVFVSFQDQINNEKLGIISTVYTASKQWNGEKLDVNVSMQKSEKYGIIVFNIPYELSVNHKIGCIIQGDKIVPLVSYIPLTSNMYFILLEKDSTLFNQNSIHIPFRRQGYRDKDFVISLISIFATSNNTYCGEGLQVDTKMSDVGCFDTVNLSKKTILNYIGLDEKGNSLNLKKISDKSNNLTLILYNINNANNKNSHKMNILPNEFKLPSNYQSFLINKENVQALRKLNNKIKISCSRCDNIRAEYVESESSNKNVKLKKDKQFETNIVKDGDMFSFVPEKDMSLLITATCDTSYNAYCEYRARFEPGVYLLIHKSSSGAKDLSYDDNISLRIEPSVSRQILNNPPDRTIVKMYKGEYELKKLVPSDVKLIINYFLNNSVEMKLMFGNNSIPFSTSKVCQYPKLFMEALGLIKEDDKYKISNLVYSSDGTITITKKSLLEPKYFDFSKISTILTDLPEGYSKASSFEIKYEKKKFNIILIASIAAGVVFIIGVSMFLIFKRKTINIENI